MAKSKPTVLVALQETEEANILQLLPLSPGPVSEQPELIKKLTLLDQAIKNSKQHVQVTLFHLLASEILNGETGNKS